jgi:site-specific DNA recombinase
VFERVQKTLADRSTGRGKRRGRRPEYLLTGILRCLPCNAAMISSLARGRNGERYRYYRCRREVNEAARCPTGLLAADEIENAVVAEVRKVAQCGDLQRSIVAALNEDGASQASAQADRARIEARLAELNAEARCMLAAFSGAGRGSRLLVERLGELEAEMDRLRLELGEIEARLRGAAGFRYEAEHVAEILDGFGELWEALVPLERRDLLHTPVRRVAYDREGGALRIQFHDRGDAASPDERHHRGGGVP